MERLYAQGLCSSTLSGEIHTMRRTRPARLLLAVLASLFVAGVLELLATAELEPKHVVRAHTQGRLRKRLVRVLRNAARRVRSGARAARVVRGRLSCVIHGGPQL
jgi:hypothetical protein